MSSFKLDVFSLIVSLSAVNLNTLEIAKVNGIEARQASLIKTL